MFKNNQLPSTANSNNLILAKSAAIKNINKKKNFLNNYNNNNLNNLFNSKPYSSNNNLIYPRVFKYKQK